MTSAIHNRRQQEGNVIVFDGAVDEFDCDLEPTLVLNSRTKGQCREKETHSSFLYEQSLVPSKVCDDICISKVYK